ncbi:MAG: PIG-L deacetylase family protein [Chloroflexota bacterium]
MISGNPFEPPDLFTAKRVLAVQPHYDDNDIAAGGTLAALAEKGTELFYLTVTNDLVGVIDQSLTEEEMTARLRTEQKEAGAAIGVTGHYWLGYPDAGKYDYFEVLRDIIQHIRILCPDFIFTCDPWMPYEAHHDHILTGRAAAEAAILFGFPRLKTEPKVDQDFEPFELMGVAFYATAYPNTVVDISQTRQKKHQAISAYRSQFSEEDMALLHMFLEFKEQEWAKEEAFSHGEPLKVLRTLHLHGYPQALHT